MPEVETKVTSTESVETPIQETQTEETTTETQEVVQEENAPEVKTFDLPDGRKVSADELYDLHVNNLLPDYTRKAQKLAEYEKTNQNITTTDVPKYKQEGYQPQSWAEVIEQAKEEAKADIARQAREEQDRVQEVRNQIDSQVAELKKSDPKLDENSLFQHAHKYGFRDLTAAHTNMQDMKRLQVNTEQRTVKNLKNREAEPIGGNSGATNIDDGYDPNIANQFSGALEYFQSRFKKN